MAESSLSFFSSHSTVSIVNDKCLSFFDCVFSHMRSRETFSGWSVSDLDRFSWKMIVMDLFHFSPNYCCFCKVFCWKKNRLSSKLKDYANQEIIAINNALCFSLCLYMPCWVGDDDDDDDKKTVSRSFSIPFHHTLLIKTAKTLRQTWVLCR